jgi:hypothetical protein
MDALLSKKARNYLPLIEQANRRQLPDCLSIAQIVELQYPRTEAERTDRDKRKVLNADRKGATEALNDACNDQLLKFSWVTIQDWYIPDRPATCHDEHLIHKDDLKAYLLDHEGKPWPIIVANLKGLLANWWPKDEIATEAVKNSDADVTNITGKQLKPALDTAALSIGSVGSGPMMSNRHLFDDEAKAVNIHKE